MLFTLLFLCNDRTDKQDNDYLSEIVLLKVSVLLMQLA